MTAKYNSKEAVDRKQKDFSCHIIIQCESPVISWVSKVQVQVEFINYRGETIIGLIISHTHTQLSFITCSNKKKVSVYDVTISDNQ